MHGFATVGAEKPRGVHLPVGLNKWALPQAVRTELWGSATRSAPG